MRTLIFSDTHLNERFEGRKFKFLKRIITGADHVIIAGDFWDGWRMSFTQFLDSQWKQLFPLLKKKNTIYLYGNHDSEKLVDKRAAVFSTKQSYEYVLRLRGKNVRVEHGHRICLGVDGKLGFLSPGPGARLLLRQWDKFEERMVRKFGRKYLKYFYGKYNEKIKKEINKRDNNFAFLVCGHTHFAEVDAKNRFCNLGLIRYGLGQYIVVENSKILPKEVRYEK